MKRSLWAATVALSLPFAVHSRSDTVESLETQVIKDSKGRIVESVAVKRTNGNIVVRNGPYTLFDTAGRVCKSGQYSNGKKEGLWKTFRDGELKFSHNYKNDQLEGITLQYYSSQNGKVPALTSETTFVAGKENGLYREFYSSGVTSVLGSYTDGKKSGTWVYYSVSGSVSRYVNH